MFATWKTQYLTKATTLVSVISGSSTMELTHTHCAARSSTNGKRDGHGTLNAKSAGRKMKPLICVTWLIEPIILTTNLDI
jgi:hypothetical protein